MVAAMPAGWTLEVFGFGAPVATTFTLTLGGIVKQLSVIVGAIFCLFASRAFAQQRSVFRADEDNRYNNGTTLNLLFDPAIDNPLVDLHAWINCPPATVVDPEFDVRIQDFKKMNKTGDLKVYRLLGYQDKSVSETCRLLKAYLESNIENRAEFFLDDEKGTAELLNMYKRGSFRDL